MARHPNSLANLRPGWQGQNVKPFHDPSLPKCSVVRKDGTRCKAQVWKRGKCYFHAPQTLKPGGKHAKARNAAGAAAIKEIEALGGTPRALKREQVWQDAPGDFAERTGHRLALLRGWLARENDGDSQPWRDAVRACKRDG